MRSTSKLDHQNVDHKMVVPHQEHTHFEISRHHEGAGEEDVGELEEVVLGRLPLLTRESSGDIVVGEAGVEGVVAHDQIQELLQAERRLVESGPVGAQLICRVLHGYQGQGQRRHSTMPDLHHLKRVRLSRNY